MIFETFFRLFLIIFMSNIFQCCLLELRNMNYFKIKSCHRSTLPQVGLKSVKNLEECQGFAREKNGLALNYSPRQVWKSEKQRDNPFINCQVMGCPELGNTTTLIEDVNYDYYSAFGYLNTTMNGTCISSTGVFLISEEKANYIDSINNCQKIGADLADVLSEKRTKQLANLVNITVDSGYKASYVGLDDLFTKGKFVSSNGNSIFCTRYRAWGPGHPSKDRRSNNCATLHSDKTWKMVPCDLKLTAICEFFPQASTIEETYQTHSCNKISTKEARKKCLAEKRSLEEIIEHSNRRDKCALLFY